MADGPSARLPRGPLLLLRATLLLTAFLGFDSEAEAAEPWWAEGEAATDAAAGLASDDECSAASGSAAQAAPACALSALQLRSGGRGGDLGRLSSAAVGASSAGAALGERRPYPTVEGFAEPASKPDGEQVEDLRNTEGRGFCHTVAEGEVEDKECYEAVHWAKFHAIYEHPEWYPNLTKLSPFEGFQAKVHAANVSLCPKPCAPVPEPCEAAERGDSCWEAITWAMLDGIYAHPEWYPGLQAGSSSREEFQLYLYRTGNSTCPLPCVLHYPRYDAPTYRTGRGARVLKGISYGPSPLKQKGARLSNDDFMSEITGAEWADWGRGDLSVIKDIGANAVRMYGNDPNSTKRTFLDAAMLKDLDVIAGISDWPYLQGPTACMKNRWYCFDEVYESYRLNLLHGFTLDGNSSYHPALKAMILINEPDLKVIPRRHLACRAVASAFDAALQAERDLNVTWNPVAFTVTWSFAAIHGQAPALGQMEDFYHCLQHVSGPPAYYTPQNDLLEAFKTRWVNSFNTANSAPSVKKLFLDKYAKSSFWTEDLKIPVFIGEYHSVHVPVRQDVKEMVATAVSGDYPFFMGFSFFEFSVRYDKGGSEKDFGMFAYGGCDLSRMNFSGKVYTIWDLEPSLDSQGDPIPEAVSDAFGGALLPRLRSSPCHGGAAAD